MPHYRPLVPDHGPYIFRGLDRKTPTWLAWLGNDSVSRVCRTDISI